MTVGCAIVAFFLIADFPEEAKWLSEDEKAFIKVRLAEDMGDWVTPNLTLRQPGGMSSVFSRISRSSSAVSCTSVLPFLELLMPTSPLLSSDPLALAPSKLSSTPSLLGLPPSP